MGPMLRPPARQGQSSADEDGRADAYVSLGVVASAAVVALGLDVADPLIGLAISVVILRITWHSWRTVRAG